MGLINALEEMMMIHPDVLKHIEGFEQSIQDRFLLIRNFLIAHIPNVVEKLGYGVPGYYVDKTNMIYVSCFKGHIGLYPGTSFIEKNQDKLSIYKTSKGTIQISHNQDIPFDLIHQILLSKGIE